MAKGPRTVVAVPDGSPEPLPGGWKNELLRYGDAVLRIEETTLASAVWEHELLHFLAPSVPEVVVPLAGPDPRPDGRIASLLPYVAGVAARPEDAAAVGELLARLHRAGLAWDGGPRPGMPSFAERDLVRNGWWDWSIVEKPRVLVEAYEEAVDFLFDPPPLVAGAVHGDLAPANVLMREGRVAGLVDWEYARVDWPAWELANAQWLYGVDLVHAYVAAGGPGETTLLRQFVRLRHVADVLYSLTSKARGEPYSPEHVETLLRALA